VDPLLSRTAKQERELVVTQGLGLDRARELVRQELFREDLDPWVGDEKYGTLRSGLNDPAAR